MYIETALSPTATDLETLRQSLIASNLAQVPELVDMIYEPFNVLAYQGTRLIGGAYCKLSWGYLFFDTVWVAEELRGTGLGSTIMRTAESHALARGITRAYLYTTSFQARSFYEKLGYVVMGYDQDRPPDHQHYYMLKPDLTGARPAPSLTIQTPADPADITRLETGLLEHAAQFAPITAQFVAVWLRDGSDTIRGGIAGMIYWRWLDMERVWVARELRGQRWGSRLLQRLETTLRQLNVMGIAANTASFQALPFYQKHGFEVVMTLPERPPGYQSYFISKRL